MFKIFTPTVVAHNIYEIDISFYKNHGYKYIICDLDNTLDAYYEKLPTQQARALVDELRNSGITLFLTSNNTRNRVEPYAKELNCEFIYSCRKPLIFKFKKVLKLKKFKKSECIIIGDQVFTDILFANRLKINSILCDNLVSKDQFFTKINKFFDKYIRRYLKRHNKLINRREK